MTRLPLGYDSSVRDAAQFRAVCAPEPGRRPLEGLNAVVPWQIFRKPSISMRSRGMHDVTATIPDAIFLGEIHLMTIAMIVWLDLDSPKITREYSWKMCSTTALN